MSTIIYTVVTTLTLTVNMNMPIGTVSTKPMNGTATTQVQSTQAAQFSGHCSSTSQVEAVKKTLKEQVEGTKVAKIISMECIN